MTSKNAIGKVVAIILIPALLISGCASEMRREVRTPAEIAARGQTSGFLKAHMRDGSAYDLSSWRVDMAAGRVSGVGFRSSAEGVALQSGAFNFPVDSVVVFETDTPAGMPPAAKALTIVLGAALAVGLAKAVFGSCPTFYASDGDSLVLQAEGFSSSIAPSLEATDVDALFRARASSDRFEITMRNEAMETHVVRSVRLLEFPRPPQGRVFAAVDGAYRQGFEITPPTRVRGPEGDCTAALASFDRIERFSVTDSTDLAAHETLELTFEHPPTGDLGLVIVSRQSLLATYLFYQSLAYMGRSAGAYLADYERGDAATRARIGQHVSGISHTLGGVDVWMPDASGRWSMVRRVKETGPLACDVRLVPLPHSAPGPVTIQLRMARGHWRLDQVALVRLGATVTPLRLEPSVVTRSGMPDTAALACLLDSTRTLVTQPGDAYTLAYELPAGVREHELFLESRGYYLEWFREDWLREEDPRRAAMMLTNPRKALRLIAPEFKRVEPELERQFWSSRYAPH